MSRDDLSTLLAKLKGLLTQGHVNEKNEVDLQRLMLSKIIKYLFTNYAKLSFVWYFYIIIFLEEILFSPFQVFQSICS